MMTNVVRPRSRWRTTRGLPVAFGLGALLLCHSRPIGGVAGRRHDPRSAPAPSPVLRTTSVGLGSFGLAVNERTGRVFVASNGTRGRGGGTGQGRLSVLDATTGRIVRTIPLGNVNYRVQPEINTLATTAMAVDERTNRVFVVANIGQTDPNATPFSPPPKPGRVDVLDGATGRVVRTVTVGVSPQGLAVDTPTRHVFVSNRGFGAASSSQPGTVSVLDAMTGAVLRTVAVDPLGSTLTVDARRRRVYLPGGDVLDATTGARVRFPFPGGCSAVDARAGRLVVSTEDTQTHEANLLRVLDASTGRVVHQESVLSPRSCPLAVDEATSRAGVFNSPTPQSVDASLTVLNTRSGRTVKTVDLTGALAAGGAVDERGNRFLVAASGGVRVLDATTGMLLRTVVTGSGIPLVAVDERTRRVFVLNTADHTLSVFDAARL